MRLAWKLSLAYAWRHPMRMLLTSLAMVASACVVVWVVSGYDALVSQFGQTASEYLGRYDLFLVPDSVKDSFIPTDLIDSLGKDTAIAEFEPVLQAAVQVRSESGGMMGGPPGMASRGGPGMAPGMGGPGMGGPSMKKRGGGRGKSGMPDSPDQAGGPDGGQGSPKKDGSGQGEYVPSGSGMAGGPGQGKTPGKSSGRPGRMPMPSSPNLVGTSAKEPPYKLAEGTWIRHDDPALREAVLSNITAEQLQAHVGDEILVILGTKEYHLKVVGIVKQSNSQPLAQRPQASSSGRPMMRMPQGPSMGPASAAVYVPMPLAEKIARQPGKVNLVNIKLKEAADARQFRAHWNAAVGKAQPAVLLVGVQDLQVAMEEGMMANSTKKQAWAATGMSLLAALFIIFTTLSMGVHERIRQFAVMRAVGLTRSQVARVIAAESVVLALIGWGGGLLAGWGLLAIVTSAKPDLFRNGASLGFWCIALTGASALGGALVASILPAWQAMSVQPLEAMSPRRSARPSARFISIAGLAGLALIAVNPLLVFVAPIPDAKRYGIYEGIGCTSMALGFLLLTPLAILLTEIVLGPVVARLLVLNPRLLASQLSSNLWRTLGTTVALSVGLGLYAAMTVWGYSMLGPFTPGDWLPDMLVSIQSGGLPPAEMDAVRKTKGVVADQCIPLAVEQPKLAEDITGSEQGNSVARQDNVILIGLDPQVAFGGASPLLRVKFVEGSAETAISKLRDGRGCVVPDHFLWATGLHVGDRFKVVPPEKPGKPVEYEIAGAVSLQGWHWMTKFSGLRRRSGRSAAMVFAGYDTVRRDFDIQQINFLWMNVDRSVGTEAVAEALQPIADRNLGERQPVNAQGTWEGPAKMFGQSLRVSTPEGVISRITDRANSMIWAMCQLPLITLLVTSLGVINTIMASVRARRWELGVMRALGVTRLALFRIILAEGLLIGLVACLLSLAFGVLAGWCGIGISQYVSFFGGMATPLVVPWSKLWVGFSAALGLCLAASLWPAISTGRAEPLKLLQAGRAAM